MNKNEVALFSAIDDIFYNQADYTNTYPVLSLDDSLVRLQLFRLPEDGESNVENTAQFITGGIGDITRFSYVQTRGYGHFFLDGEDEEPSAFFQLGDTAQLSGVVWDIQMTSWPSYDSFETSKNGTMEFTPCLILRNTLVHYRDSDEQKSLSEFDVYLPVNSSKLGLDQILYLDEIA